MVQKIVFAVFVTCFSVSAPRVTAQTVTSEVVTTNGNSAETYYCQKCQKYHTRQVSRPVVSSVPVQGTVAQPVNTTQAAQVQYSQPVQASTSPRSSSGASNVLDMLNNQRSRRGLGSLQYDPQLQIVAERRASRMAASGQKGHPSGSFAPGRYEGVGWNSSYSPSGVSACFTSDPRMRAAGAAMVSGRDGVYFCVVYR